MNRKDGTTMRNLSIFKKLCGEDSFDNIVLITTRWDDIDEETGNARERQLEAGYWKPVISRGSRVARFLGTPKSASELLGPFTDQAVARRSGQIRVKTVEPGNLGSSDIVIA